MYLVKHASPIEGRAACRPGVEEGPVGAGANGRPAASVVLSDIIRTGGETAREVVELTVAGHHDQGSGPVPQ